MKTQPFTKLSNLITLGSITLGSLCTLSAQQAPQNLLPAIRGGAEVDGKLKALLERRQNQQGGQGANINNNLLINAQAHAFLGDLAQQANNVEQSMDHFLQASISYEKLNDKRNQIMTTIDYANLFFNEKRYAEGDKIISEILPIAELYGDEMPIAATLITQSDNFYQRKRYEDAISQYTQALKYLSDQDEAIQRRLALTYHKIAQTNKRLKNHILSVAAYKKALDIYTTLGDRKSAARELHNISTEERSKDNFITALDFAIRGLELQKTLDDPEGLAKTLLSAGMIYRYLGRYEESLNHIHQAHLYYKEVNDIGGMVDTSNQIGLIYTRLKQFDQAKSFYQLTIDQSEDKVIPKNLATALREIAVIDLKNRDYKSATKMANKAHKIYLAQNDLLKASISCSIKMNCLSFLLFI